MGGYSGIGKRFLAMLIDLVIVSFADAIIKGSLGIVGLNAIANLFVIVITWGYFAYMESSEYQATLGKIVLHIKVVKLDGKPMSFARATGRYFAKYLSGAVFCIGYIMALFTSKQQALHDLIAGTIVVDK